MATIVVTPCLADANAGALCHHRPSLQQLRGPQQMRNCAIPLRSGLFGLSRKVVRGSEFTRRSLQGGPRADSETEGNPSRAEGNGRLSGLDELDNQLRTLSSSDNLVSDAKPTSNGNVETPPTREERKRVDWPVFGEGFVLFVSGGLILLTILNNILFKLFLGPPVPRIPFEGLEIPRQGTELPEQPPSDSPRPQRYKLRSYNDPKYLQQFAPSPKTDKPLS
ncbi:hypothetical protein M758_4G108600 [Ceratodon purpureus]|nr:hypothetical protein M758_4G108600 [Ceratodon purpureus]